MFSRKKRDYIGTVLFLEDGIWVVTVGRPRTDSGTFERVTFFDKSYVTTLNRELREAGIRATASFLRTIFQITMEPPIVGRAATGEMLAKFFAERYKHHNGQPIRWDWAPKE
jgi:hypothetical protein